MVIVISLILVVYLRVLPVTRASPDETKLYRLLLEDYEILSRPVENYSHAINVSIGLTLQQLLDVDEKNQIMQTNIWLTYRWSDYRLSWNPNDHGGIREIRLPPSRVWKPDVILYNSVSDNFDPTYFVNVVVKHDGSIEWLPPGIIKSTCKIDITWFPFDEQRCVLKFGSWTYSRSFMDLQLGDVVNSTYTENGEWHLMGILATRNEFKYDCCPEPYYDINFVVWVRRRTLYYGFNFIIPCALISLMTLLDFVLPPDSGEKLTLGITIFMSLCVFLLMVAETIPPTSDAVPLIGMYFSSIMIVVSASHVMTVCILNLHYRSPKTHFMSPCFRKVFLEWLPWLLMMRRPGKLSPGCCRLSSYPPPLPRIKDRRGGVGGRMPDESTSMSLLSNCCLEWDASSGPGSSLRVVCEAPQLPHTTLRENGALTTGSKSIDGISGTSVSASAHKCSCHCGSKVLSFGQSLGEVTQDLLKHLSFITARMRREDEIQEVVDEWKFAAMVVDRFSLILFTMIIVVSTGCILFAAPHFSDVFHQ